MLPLKNNVGIKAQGRGYSIAATIFAETYERPLHDRDDGRSI